MISNKLRFYVFSVLTPVCLMAEGVCIHERDWCCLPIYAIGSIFACIIWLRSYKAL